MSKKVYLIRSRHVTYSSGEPFKENQIEYYQKKFKNEEPSYHDYVQDVSLSKRKAEKLLEDLRKLCSIYLRDDSKYANPKGWRTHYYLTIYEYYIEMRYTI